MKEFREIAGERSFAVPRFVLGEGDGRQEYALIDAYCDDPLCIGSEINVRLEPERSSDPAIVFDIDTIQQELHFERKMDDRARALACEFAEPRGDFLARRRQVVRAWALAANGRPLKFQRERRYGFGDFSEQEGFFIPFQHRGRAITAMDLYCANPACPCAEARLHFYSEGRQGKSGFEFGALLDMDSGQAQSTAREPLPEVRRVVFSSLQECLGDWRGELSLRKDLLLRVARKRMRFPAELTGAFAGEDQADLIVLPGHPRPGAHATAAPEASRPGRNDPCHCGSGREYQEMLREVTGRQHGRAAPARRAAGRSGRAPRAAPRRQVDPA